MSRFPSDEIVSLVNLLVQNLTGFKDETPEFISCADFILTNLDKAESLFFLKKKDVDSQIFGQADKFEFHGFKRQAELLRKNYAGFIPDDTAESELHHKLMIVRFLICLSESPTKFFLENPNLEKVSDEKKEEEIDWGVILKEGFERWSPNFSSSSDEWSVESIKIEPDPIETPQFDEACALPINLDVPKDKSEFVNVEELRKQLYASVQSGWFNRKRYQEIPETTIPAGRTAFAWDEFTREQSYGLLDPQTIIISEYKVMREVIWQLLTPHTAVCFKYDGKEVIPQPNVTIASVRAPAFTEFLSEFIPMFNILNTFRDFRATFHGIDADKRFPGMYITYSECVNDIITPFKNEVIKIEMEVKKQESCMTLLKLSYKLRELFKDIWIWKGIHDEIVLDYKENPPLICSVVLLTGLRDGLANKITSKMELDVYLSLYVGSLHRYLQIIYWWFHNDNLRDVYDEFIIANQNNSERDYLSLYYVFSIYDHTSDSDLTTSDYPKYFHKKELDESISEDNFFQLITSKVIEIGNNIRLIRKLGKIMLLNTTRKTDIYEDFIERLFKKMYEYFKVEIPQELNEEESEEEDIGELSAMCPDYVKYPLELDKIKNVLPPNPYLMETFKEFFQKKKPKKVIKKTLYQRISETTTTVFPAEKFVDASFKEVLEERYGHTGFIIRDLFKSEYRIEEHFEILSHLYLLKDGLLTSWFDRLFNHMHKSVKIENSIWLTGRLQDLLLDSFPMLHEQCFVDVTGGGLHGTPIEHVSNPCQLIEIVYKVDWPITVVIQDYDVEMYKEVFQVIASVKWALYSLTHMFFTDIQPKAKIGKQHIAVTILLRRLNVSRFWLINQFSALHHYIFGTVVSNASIKFKKNLSEANGLNAIMVAHRNFLTDIHKSAMALKEYKSHSYGFDYLLYLVNKLKSMWNDLENVEDKELDKLEKYTKICYENFEKFINTQILGSFY